MQHVSRELSAEMVEKGWVKETAFKYVLLGGEWVVVRGDSGTFKGKVKNWHPAMSLDEVLEEVNYDDLHYLYSESHPNMHHTSPDHWVDFSMWLYTTMRSADTAARVWLKMREGK